MLEYAPISERRMTYEEAVLYCQFCTHGGHNDWRMPTGDEYLKYKQVIGWYENDAHTALIAWFVQPVRCK